MLHGVAELIVFSTRTSFALIAYASAYLKCHYLAAFTCALAADFSHANMFQMRQFFLAYRARVQ